MHDGGVTTFAQQCIEAFAPLVTLYGFAEPEVQDYGRETFVRFHKVDSTVSVSREVGALR